MNKMSLLMISAKVGLNSFDPTKRVEIGEDQLHDYPNDVPGHEGPGDCEEEVVKGCVQQSYPPYQKVLPCVILVN